VPLFGARGDVPLGALLEGGEVKALWHGVFLKQRS